MRHRPKPGTHATDHLLSRFLFFWGKSSPMMRKSFIASLFPRKNSNPPQHKMAIRFDSPPQGWILPLCGFKVDWRFFFSCWSEKEWLMSVTRRLRIFEDSIQLCHHGGTDRLTSLWGCLRIWKMGSSKRAMQLWGWGQRWRRVSRFRWPTGSSYILTITVPRTSDASTPPTTTLTACVIPSRTSPTPSAPRSSRQGGAVTTGCEMLSRPSAPSSWSTGGPTSTTQLWASARSGNSSHPTCVPIGMTRGCSPSPPWDEEGFHLRPSTLSVPEWVSQVLKWWLTHRCWRPLFAATWKWVPRGRWWCWNCSRSSSSMQKIWRRNSRSQIFRILQRWDLTKWPSVRNLHQTKWFQIGWGERLQTPHGWPPLRRPRLEGHQH